MIIHVMVRLNSSKQTIENFGNNRYLVYLFAKKHTEANQELLAFLSKSLGAPITHITLIKGQDSNNKVFEIK